ncbi:MAG: hypothetical protein HOC91_08290 [Nitrospinaceae bacterium]|jgi:hypothetical protein|nr:hypothetical protein [Nitrospinaceae bacterium]MBT3434271.1 hypothetical protein [Nitrospinaceae bacterium]MBT3819935.1 hypothetical protein [Nitrospinaceae bacterium]MBT4093730.1 hypothetical protein [Nitrospinaceae bacterium]MBT4430498.1 hypothetical protein [Nitrospinaceae bacterium]
MNWIHPMKLDEAKGASKEIIDKIRAGGRPVSKFLLALGRRSEVLSGRETLRNAAYGGSTLGVRREQMLAFFVAAHGG